MRTSWLSPVLLALAAAPPAQQFSLPRQLPGDDAVHPSAGNQRRPHVAPAPGGGWLAVWEDDRSSLVDTVHGGQAFGSSVPGNFDVYATFVDAQGQPVGPAPFLVNGDTWDQQRVRVASSGGDFLVVFESTKPTQFYHSRGVYAVRVSGGGAVLDTTPIRVDDDDGIDEMYPTVTGVPGGWAVAWMDTQNGMAVIRGATVGTNGVVAAPVTMVTGTTIQLPAEPVLTAAGNQVLLAWSLGFGSGVYAQRFTTALAPQGGVLTLAATQGNHPAVGAHATGYYAAWFGNGMLRGTPIDTAGTVLVPGGAPLTNGGDSACAVGHDGSNWTVALDVSPAVVVVPVAANGVPGAAVTVTTTPRSLDDIAVGSGPGRTLVLWTDRRQTANSFGADVDDVFGATLTAGGGLGATTPVSVSPPAQTDAVIAGDGEHGFLCVCKSRIAGVTSFVAHALDGAGNPLGAPFVVHSGDRSLDRPDVAWNGSEFVVVWGQLQSTVSNGPPPLVFAQRVRLDGTFVDPSPMQVMEGSAPAVDVVGGVALIVARYHHVVLQSNAAMRCRRLGPAPAGFLDAAPVVILIGVGGGVDVVGLTDRWLVAWGAVTAAFVTAAGVPQPPFYAADAGSTSGGLPRLSANADGSEAVMAYQFKTSSMPHPDVYMRRIHANGTSPDPLLGPAVSTTNHGQRRPIVVRLEDDYLALWADHRDSLDIEPGLGDVYAARLSLGGALLDPNGIPVHDTPRAEGGVFAQRSGRGTAVVVASTIVEGAFGTHRLQLSTYTNPAAAPWTTVGSGLAGAVGVPSLVGHGTLVGGATFDLRVAGAAANAPGVLVLGFAAAGTPLLGGVLVPSPVATTFLATDAGGRAVFVNSWPAGFGGTTFLAQHWSLDAGAVQGVAATPGVRGVAP